jgi:hypothetical protein
MLALWCHATVDTPERGTVVEGELCDHLGSIMQHLFRVTDGRWTLEEVVDGSTKAQQ